MANEDEVVRKAPLFTALDDAAAASLRTSMDSVKINKGGFLFKEGDRGEHVYIIIEGKLKLGTSSSDGRENLLSILGPGEMFGELSHSLIQAHALQLPRQSLMQNSYLLATTNSFLGFTKILKSHYSFWLV